MELYTTGQIFRLGLLKNRFGKPYKHKSTVSKVVQELGSTAKENIHGLAKCLTEGQIKDYNQRLILDTMGDEMLKNLNSKES